MSDSEIEKEIQAKGKTAPRVTLDDIKANIASIHYFTAAQGAFGAAFASVEDPNKTFSFHCPDALDVLTFCVLMLKNGFTVSGKSACASPENFDAEIGKRIALDNAVQKIWPLMGYALKEQLAAAELAPAASCTCESATGQQCAFCAAGGASAARSEDSKEVPV